MLDKSQINKHNHFQKKIFDDIPKINSESSMIFINKNLVSKTKFFNIHTNLDNTDDINDAALILMSLNK